MCMAEEKVFQPGARAECQQEGDDFENAVLKCEWRVGKGSKEIFTVEG